MKSLVVVLALLEVTTVIPSPSGGENYLNHHLVDVNITDEEERQFVNNLADVGNMGLDFWVYPTLKRTGRMRVPPESIDRFMQLMTKAGFSAKIRHNNLKQLNDEVKDMPRSPDNCDDFIQGEIEHNAYFRMDAIEHYMTKLGEFSGATKRYLSQQTYEGRSIPYMEITGGTGSNNKRIFIEAGMHAREWISPASALYFVDRLLHRRSEDDDASYLYNNFDCYVVPVSNPDGYQYTHTSDRYWTKNRQAVSGCGSDRGVDLNRNFDAMWGGSGSSGSCRSDTYRGPSVFSEVESQNIRDKVQEIKSSAGTIHAYLSIHSFSQLLLTPYGYAANTYPPNIAEICAGGSSCDWARQTESIQYAMTYVLRPASDGLEGFELPTSQIAPCSKEVWDSIYAIASNL